MKVSTLIKLLEECEPDANVILMTQTRWPFECSIHGVTTRAAVRALDPEDDAGVDSRGKALNASDVYIVEGEQLRYGHCGAWQTCR